MRINKSFLLFGLIAVSSLLAFNTAFGEVKSYSKMTPEERARYEALMKQYEQSKQQSTKQPQQKTN